MFKKLRDIVENWQRHQKYKGWEHITHEDQIGPHTVQTGFLIKKTPFKKERHIHIGFRIDDGDIHKTNDKINPYTRKIINHVGHVSKRFLNRMKEHYPNDRVFAHATVTGNDPQLKKKAMIYSRLMKKLSD